MPSHSVLSYTTAFLWSMATVGIAHATQPDVLEPDWRAVLQYGGYGAMIGVIGAMWSPKARTRRGFLRLIVTAFFIAGAIGAAFAEWRGQPTVALGVTVIVSFFLPALMTDWKGTVTAILSVLRHQPPE